MTEKKITKRERFADLLTIPEVAENEERVAFIKREMELLDRKRSGNGKLTPAQEENEKIKDKIMEIVSTNGGGMTVTQIMQTDGMGEYSMNKMINLVARQLKSENRLIRYEKKGVAYFRLPEFEGEVNEVKEK